MMQRGFTAIELAIVISISALVVPLIYAFGRNIEDHTTLGQWHLESAEAIRTVAEELRRDGRGEAVAGDEVAFVVDGCEVRYTADDRGVLLREAPADCGGSRGLARFVESIARSPGGVDLTFARTIRPDRTHRVTVFIPAEAP